MYEELKQQVVDLVEEPLRREGGELVEVVIAKYRNNWTVRLFVFSERGTTIGECARLSRIVEDLLEGTDWFESGYTLEVSSPGLDRPLTTARDFKYRIGETVKIKFVDPERKQDAAEIVSATDEEVTFKDDNGYFRVPLSEIQKATIVF